METVKELPPRPNLRHLKCQAEDLRTALTEGDPGALSRLKSIPELADYAAVPKPELSVGESQLVVAREYGFPSWRALKVHVESILSGIVPPQEPKEVVEMKLPAIETGQKSGGSVRGRWSPLSALGDWASRIREIDIVERHADRATEPLRAILEDIGFKVNRAGPNSAAEAKEFLRKGRFDAPIMVLIVRGAGKGKKQGIFMNDYSRHLPENVPLLGAEVLLPEDIAKSSVFKDKVVLCMGEGLGTRAMAGAFFRAGATAYIGIAGADPGKSASRLFFLIRFFHEIGWNQATIREAWERAAVNDRGTREFRLYVPHPGTKRPVALPTPRPNGSLKGILPRVRDPRGRTDWRLPVNEVDLLTSVLAPADNAETIRMLLEPWGIKVNLCPFRGAGELQDYLKGRGLRAPVVALLSHGTTDGKGKWGIVMDHGSRSRKPSIFPAERIARIVNLPGRVLLAVPCIAEHRDAAAAFLKGGLRAYIAGGDYAHTKQMAMLQFFYELAVNKATVRQAWERSVIGSYSPGLMQLYPGGTGAADELSQTPATVPARGLIEGFEGNTGSRSECDHDIGFFDITPGRPVPAPEGRPGLAFRLNFDFRQKEWPNLSIYPRKDLAPRPGARMLAMDVYVPRSLVLQGPLTLMLSIYGTHHECAISHSLSERGWTRLEFPFADSRWRGREGKGAWKPEPVSPGNLSPLKFIWMTLQGTGRREEGSVFFDNIRMT